ncbi:preprotein translocase subunit YajC [Streptococcus suis]|uniref:preprotein translocase subunit YajC n=1 Tax=Streptococcus suis TaxID=1307 RepID=UPI0003F79185|nr:preprotein translocase subunit YajC [Streptococcus suis]MBL1156785.1 preprotein translocase subunit YajC [Streptococcus suis]MBL3697400.1 preprotein translocase subunit YajC [Streptococcus suis]MBM6381546.1 preprotein translocase subunit YajC [Streptococcus suis]MBM6389349.1 preprotein translocase subunit YajC [Streptococcus suis]MBM6391286.1 preprotein translocase subunit YajC [Streptococcus suis]
MEGLFLPLVMVAMIGFMFYSQRKQQKQRQEALNQIKKGDEIVTIGGLFGIVDEIDDKKVVLDVDGVYLTFERGAIRNRVASSGTTSAVVEEVAVETTEAAIEE